MPKNTHRRAFLKTVGVTAGAATIIGTGAATIDRNETNRRRSASDELHPNSQLTEQDQTTTGPPSSDNWRMNGYDVRRTGYNRTAKGPGSDGKIAWNASIDDDHVSTPVAVDDTVYVGGDVDTDSDHTANVHALDVSNGSERWRFSMSGVKGSPAVVDGVVYVGTNDRNLYALDADDGTKRWKYEVTDNSTASITSSPVVADGVIFLTTREGKLRAISDDGQRLWRAQVEQGRAFVAGPAVADGVVYVGTDQGNLVAFDASDGTERWRYTPSSGDPGRIYDHPAVADDVVYYTSDNQNLYAIDAKDGSERWHTSTSDATSGATITAPAVSNDSVYLRNGNGNLCSFAVDDGSLRWKYSHPTFYATPSIAHGRVYVSTPDSVVALDSESGETVAEFSVPAYSPPIVTDDSVYLAGYTDACSIEQHYVFAISDD